MYGSTSDLANLPAAQREIATAGLNAPLEIRKFFFRVICKYDLENFEIKVWGKIAAQCVFYIAKSLGYSEISVENCVENANFYYIRNGFSQKINPNTIKKIKK